MIEVICSVNTIKHYIHKKYLIIKGLLHINTMYHKICSRLITGEGIMPFPSSDVQIECTLEDINNMTKKRKIQPEKKLRIRGKWSADNVHSPSINSGRHG